MLSSVALLQQRFRDLERMKEMREGRSSSCVGISSAGIHNPNNATLWPGTPVIVFGSTSDHGKPRWFFHPDLVCPSRPLFETKFVCLVPATESSRSTSVSLQPPPATTSTPEEETDIDTSLHL